MKNELLFNLDLVGYRSKTLASVMFGTIYIHSKFKIRRKINDPDDL